MHNIVVFGPLLSAVAGRNMGTLGTLVMLRMFIEAGGGRIDLDLSRFCVVFASGKAQNQRLQHVFLVASAQKIRTDYTLL